MRKATVGTAVILAALSMLTGCSRDEVQESIQPLVADAIEEADSEAEAVEEEEEMNLIPEFDPAVEVQPGARIAVVSKSTKGEFWNRVKKGMEAAVKDANEVYGFEKKRAITMTFEGPEDEHNVDEQINILDAVLAENPDVLCVSVGDMDSCQAQLEMAKENRIPVVAFDANVSEKKLVRAFRATDNVEAGKMAAYRLGRTIGKMGKVAVFSAQEKTQSIKDRTEGFVENISKYTDIEVVEVVYGDQVEDMEAAMQEVLHKYPTLDGVFCSNADVAEMYLNMEKDIDNREIAMVGMDATSRQQKAIREGEEIGVVSQQPFAMGYQAIWTSLMTTAPKKSVTYERNVLVTPVWIDAVCLDDPKYKDYLYSE